MRSGIPTEAAVISVDSLSDATLKQYHTAFIRWRTFCARRGLDPNSPTVATLLVFLTEVFNQGASYGTLNSFRSAISSLTNNTLGNDKAVSRFMKGVFKRRPPRPKYQLTWDVAVVLTELRHWHPPASLSLQKLSWKVVTLVALVTAHRSQTLAKIVVANITRSNQGLEIRIPEIIKTSRVGADQPLLALPVFPGDPALCVASLVSHYIDRTNQLRKDSSRLLPTYITSLQFFPIILHT